MARAGDVYIKRRSERQSDFGESPQERITRHDSSGFPRRRPGRVLGGQDTTLHAPRKPSRSSFMKRSPPRSPGCEYGMRPSLTAQLYKVLGGISSTRPPQLAAPEPGYHQSETGAHRPSRVAPASTYVKFMPALCASDTKPLLGLNLPPSPAWTETPLAGKGIPRCFLHAAAANRAGSSGPGPDSADQCASHPGAAAGTARH